jgi:hypothetical protein
MGVAVSAIWRRRGGCGTRPGFWVRQVVVGRGERSRAMAAIPATSDL